MWWIRFKSFEFLKKKKIIWLFVSLPLVAVIFQLLMFSFKTSLFWDRSLVIAGYTASILLALCLMLSPLHKNFPSLRVFNFLNRRKREIGLAVFFYACIHALSYFLRKYTATRTFEWIYLLHPIIIPGEIAFLIFFFLSITSNNFSIQWLGWKKWKSLHRLIYIAEGAVFVHMLLQKGTVLIFGCVIFALLFSIQRLRLRQN